MRFNLGFYAMRAFLWRGAKQLASKNSILMCNFFVLGFKSTVELHHRWDALFSVYLYTNNHTIAGLNYF